MPAKPSIAPPSMVSATVRAAANRAAPTTAPAAEYHSSAARGRRRASRAKLAPVTTAPTDHSAEYTPSTV